MSQSVTIKMLAAETGFSKETVSHILSGKARKYHYSRKTEQTITRTARRLGYMPNSMARAARNGCSRAIGLIHCSSPAKSYMPDSLMNGIQEEITRRNYHLVLACVTEDILQGKRIPKMLSELMVDGFLTDYLYPSCSPIIKRILHSRKPHIAINVDLDKNCFRPNDRQGGFDATQYLIGLGHKRISFVDLSSNIMSWNEKSFHYSELHRYEGYRDAMLQVGYQPGLILGDEFMRWVDRGDAAAPQTIMPWLFSKNRPTAILTYHAPTGLATIFRAADEQGIKIPEDLSILTFSNKPYRLDGFSMTTMIEPFHTIGGEAASALIDKIENGSGDLPAREFPFSIVPGKSCAPPSEAGKKQFHMKIQKNGIGGF